MVAHVLAERTQAGVCSQNRAVPQTARPRAMRVQVGCTTMLVATPANTGKQPVIFRFVERVEASTLPRACFRSYISFCASDCICQSFACRPGRADFRSAAEWASPGAVKMSMSVPPHFGGPAHARESQQHPTKPTIHRVK